MPRHVPRLRPLLSYYCLWLSIYIHIYIITGIVKIVHEDYTMLTPKRLGEASLQLLAACVPLTFIGVLIPAKYKVTESMM